MHFQELLTDTWPDDQVVVGRWHDRLVALDKGQPLLVVGPPRAGKTTGINVPNVSRWRGNVVATSIRADVLDVTYAQRARLGEVRVFDPTDTLGYSLPGHLDFVTPCMDFDVARTTARAVMKYMRSDNMREGEFWRTSASRLLSILLFAGAHAERPIDAVTSWLTSSSSHEVAAALEGAGNSMALEAYDDFVRGSDSYVGSVRATALAAIQPYEDSRVARNVQAGGLDPDEFLAGAANTLYLCLPPEDQRLLAPYSALVVDQIVAAKHRRARFRDANAAPLLLALDEAMNIAPLQDLAVLASTAAGTGIQLITIAHDFSQIVARYGEAEAHTIVANHSLLLLGGGLREHALGVLLDRLVDPNQIPGAHGWTGTASEWVRRLDASQGLLIHRDLPPEVIDITRWFDDDTQVVEHLNALYELGEHDPTSDDDGREPVAVDAANGGTDDREIESSGWSRFECGPTGVSARFPASPSYERTPADDGSTRHLLRHEDEDWSVSLDVTEIDRHSSTSGGTSSELEQAAAGIAHELEANVLTRESARVGDYDALDVDMVGRGHHTHVRITSTKTCLVAARMRGRTPDRAWFTEFAGTLEITRNEADRPAPIQLHLDRSGRVTVPVWLRNRISEPLVMSLWNRRVRVWSRSAFDAKVDGFHKHLNCDAVQRHVMRGFLASSASTRIDDRGRLYLPERFRSSCGIGIVVVFHPTDDGFELGPLE